MIEDSGRPGANAVEIERWNSEFGQNWVAYQQDLDAAFASVRDRLIELARIEEGGRVLDVGCGAGAVTIEAAARVGSTGRVLGVDISRPLLELARRRCAVLSNVDFLEGDAQTHPFQADGYDLLVSRFGLMFFEDPPAAFANMASALRAGGRMVFVSWAPLERNPWFEIPNDAAVARLGAPAPTGPRAPGPFAFAEVDYVTGILREAGLTAVSARTRSVQLECPMSLEQAGDLAAKLGPAARIHREKNGTAEDLEAIIVEVKKGFARYVSASGFSIPATIHFFEATKV